MVRSAALSMYHRRDETPVRLLWPVLIDSSGRTKLCDLGQSKFIDRASIAVGGVGTIDYMPPEALMLDGSEGDLDEKKWDVYSCGIILWYSC